MKFWHRHAVWVLAACTLLPATSALAQETARGVVYHDRNNNGARDSGEKGIAGVRVSNGSDIVTTGEDGGYALPVGDDTIVFVLKPRDWMTPVDETQLPQFYYIHKPKGSPRQQYPGVKPTGGLPESIDFPLVRREEPDTFQAIMFGDTQARDPAEQHQQHAPHEKASPQRF